MKNWWIRVLTVGGLLGVAFTASAGTKSSWPVYINSSVRYAQGSLGTARNSADTSQTMSCNAQSGGWGYCFARDAATNIASCYATTEAQLATIRGINGDSAVYFDWNTSGYCGTIIVYQSSTYEPKQP